MCVAIEKLHSARGLSRLAALLLLAAAALLAAASAPAYRAYKERADRIGCGLALKKARDAVTVDHLLRLRETPDMEAASAIVDAEARGAGELCPAGGDYYVVSDAGEGAGVRVVCGLHEEDLRLVTRLSAENALRQINAAVADARRCRRGDPDEIAVTLNGKTFAALRVEAEKTDLRRGTYATPGYDGTAAYYMLDGGGISYLCFADPNYCASWKRVRGWDGDAWGS